MIFLSQATGGSSMFTTFFLPLILMVVVFYFLILRPSQKRNKDRNKMLSAIQKGDKIVTIGGLHGMIEELSEDKFTLKTADGTRLTFDRDAIARAVAEPAEGKTKA
jgi:preprotein translocase subunit YajC